MRKTVPLWTQSQTRARNNPKENVQIERDNAVCIFVMTLWGSIIGTRSIKSEMKTVLDNFKFETFVNAPSNIFEEYLSSVISKLRETNSEYRCIEKKIESLYRQYPKVMVMFDTEKSSDLSEQECTVLIEILELRTRLCDMQQEAIYFRGCYDSVGYLKKAGIL